MAAGKGRNRPLDRSPSQPACRATVPADDAADATADETIDEADTASDQTQSARDTANSAHHPAAGPEPDPAAAGPGCGAVPTVPTVQAAGPSAGTTTDPQAGRIEGHLDQAARAGSPFFPSSQVWITSMQAFIALLRRTWRAFTSSMLQTMDAISSVTARSSPATESRIL